MSLSIFLNGGLGDVAAITSLMTSDEQSRLSRVYWAAKSAPLAISLFNLIPRFRHLEHVVFDVTTFNLAGARENNAIPPEVEDWSIGVIFGQFFDRPFSRSPFLEVEADLSRFKIPDEYVLIQHESPLHGAKEDRDFDEGDWAYILGRLEAEDRHAVVVNSPDCTNPPIHPRLTNLVGLTSFAESIALLRSASAFWGCASSLCVLACQVFDADDLLIKGPNPFLSANRCIYFAPHRSFPFWRLRLSEPRPVCIDNSMEKLITIQMKVARLVNNTLLMPGSLVDVPLQLADEYIKYGEAARYVEKPKPVDPPKPEEVKKPEVKPEAKVDSKPEAKGA